MKTLLFFVLTLMFCATVYSGIEQEIFINFRGDADGSGSVTISDSVYINNYLFGGGPAPSCMAAADANSSGSVEISDSLFILNYLFDGGAAPNSYTVECVQ